MRAHYLQHVPFERLGAIESWLRSAGYDVTTTRFFEPGAELPQPSEIDFLVVLGGPMSANDDARHPWLLDEKYFIRAAVAAGTPVLGVCLGAQLVAGATGGHVYPNRTREIGWHPIDAVMSDTHHDVFRFPPRTQVFHWHGDTFDLPPDAVLLASSTATLNQAFQLGRSVIGLQFHLEVTQPLVAEMVAHGIDDLRPGPHVQTAQEILAVGRPAYGAANDLLRDVLDYLHASRPERSPQE